MDVVAEGTEDGSRLLLQVAGDEMRPAPMEAMHTGHGPIAATADVLGPVMATDASPGLAVLDGGPELQQDDHIVAAQLESICFADVSTPLLSESPVTNFVNTVRGSLPSIPLHLPPETSTPVKTSVAHFATSVCRQSLSAVLEGSPIRRVSRPQITPSLSLRRSERLAKRPRMSNPILQAQNVLMKRLGISSQGGTLDAAAFQ